MLKYSLEGAKKGLCAYLRSQNSTCLTPLHILFWEVSEFVLAVVSLGAVAFITLLERKYLGLSQIRLGPNKVTLIGSLQPLADGVKLLAKQFLKRGLRQSLLFLVSPILLLMIFLLLWTGVLVWEGSNLASKVSCLVFFSFLGVSTYAVILTGWAIMRTFAKLGRLRGILQRLSYEVAIILAFLVILLLYREIRFNFRKTTRPELFIWWFVLWFILSMMETNRAPFDLLEGERELIRGFNIEIGSLIFVFLFLREYGMIILMSIVFAISIFGTVNIIVFVIRRLILVARSCYPRVRYDTLMRTMWQSILPITLISFYFVILNH